MTIPGLDEFDLASWLAGHGAQGRGRELVLRCPVCGKKNLAVNVDRKLWHCWTCERYVVDVEGKRRAVDGAGGVIKLVQLLEGLTAAQAREKIGQAAIYSYRDVSRLPIEKLDNRYAHAIKPAEPMPLPEGWRPVTEVLPFMQQRQITLEDARTFGLGWCDRGRFRGRLIFPVLERGRLLYYQGRAMWTPQPGERAHIKALNPASGEHHAVSSELLMNLEQASRYPRVAIVEGPTDLVRTGPDAVCSFGKRLTDAQVGRLLRAGVRAIDLMWDSDARKEMQSVALRLAGIFDLRVVLLASGDPGDYPRPYLTAARRQAVGLQASKLMEL